MRYPQWSGGLVAFELGRIDNDRLPVMLLGGGGGWVHGGRVLDYSGDPDRQLCRLFLSLMDKWDVHPTSFGDATRMLEEV